MIGSPFRASRRQKAHRLAATLSVTAVILAGCAQGGGGSVGGRASAGGLTQLPPGIAGHLAPRIRLADARGGTLDTSALRDRPYALTFLYANCPDVCPLIADELRAALSELGPQAARVAVVAVSVDPRGDTPQAVRDFLKRHREPGSFHYLIGSEKELKPVWKDYYTAPQIPGDPKSAHSAAIWLVDARGRIAGKFDAGAPVEASDIAAVFRRLLAPE